MRTLLVIAVAGSMIVGAAPAYAWKPGYPKHCHFETTCHKNTEFPCVSSAEANLPVCKKQICTTEKVCD
jgi:hypothetical protein